jgi:GlcNAc-P-P-Und epimerase
VLVTGGTGFLGRAILTELTRAGYDAWGLQRTLVTGEGRTVAGDVRDPAVVAGALRGMETVVHAAGLAHVFHSASDAAFNEVNAGGTETVARAAVAAGVRHFVLVSSVAVYGGDAAGGREDAPSRPVGAYAVSKAEAERRAIATLRTSAARLTILRLATLYGEGDRGNVQRLLRLIARGRFVWIGSGSNQKSLVHVEDAARACTLPLSRDGEAIEIYNVSMPPVTMRAVVDGLAQALDCRIRSWHVPGGVALTAAAALHALAPRRGLIVRDALRKWLSSDVYPGDAFGRRFDFDARVPLVEGLRRQVRWWQECRPSTSPR